MNMIDVLKEVVSNRKIKNDINKHIVLSYILMRELVHNITNNSIYIDDMNDISFVIELFGDNYTISYEVGDGYNNDDVEEAILKLLSNE